MIIVDADKIASNLANYLEKVKGGESFVIAVHNEPVAELRPAEAPGKLPRPFGLCAGEFQVPDDFDTPLPDEIIADFESR